MFRVESPISSDKKSSSFERSQITVDECRQYAIKSKSHGDQFIEKMKNLIRTILKPRTTKGRVLTFGVMLLLLYYIVNMWIGGDGGGGGGDPLAIDTVNRGGVATSKEIIYACMRFQGGLGNYIFQYAFMVSLEKTIGANIVIPVSSGLAEIFHVTYTETALSKAACEAVPDSDMIGDEKDCAYDPTVYRRIPVDRHYKFNGYFQSWIYWLKYEQDLVPIFKLKPTLLTKAQEILVTILRKRGISSLYQQGITLVGMHVRRGDMMQEEVYINYGYRLPQKDYLLKAMTFYRRRHKRVLFIICSNGIDWTKRQLQTEVDTYFVDGHSPEIDMSLLSLTNHTIITVGSFGWWVGWLTNGTTVYYSQPYVEGSELSKQYNEGAADYFYPGWIGLS